MTGEAGGERPRCVLTTRDHSIVEAMHQRRIASGDAILPLLGRKLAEATVVDVDQVAADIVTLNSRVVFRVDGGTPETRTLVRQEDRGLIGSNLPVSTPRGLALLGMSEGQQAIVERIGGGQETLLVEKVFYQPEAARRQTTERAPSREDTGEREDTGRRPALRLVHSATPDVQPAGDIWRMRQSGRDDDDPGPSAA